MGELKERRASCTIVVVEANLQGARHGNCGAETAGCQAETRRATKGVSLLWGRNLSALGTSEETGEGYPGQAGAGVSVSLLSVPAYLSALSGGE